jgi:hypothetical protein
MGITIGEGRSGGLGLSPLRTVEAAAMRLSPKARLTSGFGVREACLLTIPLINLTAT